MTPQELFQIAKSQSKFHSTAVKEMSFSDWVKNLHMLKDEVIFITDRIKLINRGFPSTFNLSFAEDFWTRMLEEIPGGKIDKFYNYLQLPPHGFSAIAPVIRMEDLEKILKKSQTHLLFFHMVSINGCAVTEDNNAYEFFIINFFDFLERIGLDPKKFLITIHPGNETMTKHNVTFQIPPNKTLKFFKSLAKEKGFQLKMINKETFLALKLFGSPTPWGFRNEIFYRWNNNLVDIATFEWLYFSPEFDIKDGKIVYTKITQWDKMAALDGIGFERFLFILNNLKSVYDLPPFIEIERIIFQKSQIQKEFGARLMGQLLLALSAIFCEVGGFSRKHLGGGRRKNSINTLLYYFFITKDILKTEIDIELLRTIFLAYNNYFHFEDLKLDMTTLSNLVSALNEEYFAYQKFISKREHYSAIVNIEKLQKIDEIKEKIEAFLH